jgi:hypothetical protein
MVVSFLLRPRQFLADRRRSQRDGWYGAERWWSYYLLGIFPVGGNWVDDPKPGLRRFWRCVGTTRQRWV